MTTLALPDLLAFAWFCAAWIGYSIVIEKTEKGRSGLNSLMNTYRDEWMERLLARDMRMVDAQVTAALQNGTAFFASTSLIAVGGTLTLLRSTEEILTIVSVLPFGATSSASDHSFRYPRILRSSARQGCSAASWWACWRASSRRC